MPAFVRARICREKGKVHILIIVFGWFRPKAGKIIEICYATYSENENLGNPMFTLKQITCDIAS